MRTYRRATPYLFLLPHGVFFLAFVLAPLFFGIYISLHQWGLFAGRMEFVGLKYYLRLFDFDFVRTGYYWRSLWVTLQFVLLSVPPLVALGLGLALLLNARELGEWPRRLFRTLYLLPAALSITVVAVVWRWVLLYDNGLLNHGLAALGMEKVPWLTEQPGAWFGIVATTVWCTVGWNMILLLVGLQQIPVTLYEAAALDGAGPWRTFRDITLPNLRRILVFVVIVQIIASFNLFAQPQLMTGGGPDRSTLPVMLYIYTEAFNPVRPRIGSACAMAFTTGLVMLGFLVLQFRLFVRRTDG